MKSNNHVNLVVVAHPDDEILGFGGTGARLTKQGESVQPLILCGDVQQRTHRPTNKELHQDIKLANSIVSFNEPIVGNFPNIRMNNVDQVEIVKFIEDNIRKYDPKRIFTHHPQDLNDDHKQIALACMAASRLGQRNNKVTNFQSLSFVEILSSTDWSYSTGECLFKPNHYINLPKTYLDIKLKALAAYRNIMRSPPHPRSVEGVTALATHRGCQSGCIYAEAFQTIFLKDF
ncbi:PIG-L family deacetylase [bacterium]|nr:PIG-L family deacetylase [bacterium]